MSLSVLPCEVRDGVVHKLSTRDQARVACVDRDMRDRVRRLDAFGRLSKFVEDETTAAMARLSSLLKIAEAAGGGVGGMDALEAAARESGYAVDRCDEIGAIVELPGVEASAQFRAFRDGTIYMHEIFPRSMFWTSLVYIRPRRCYEICLQITEAVPPVYVSVRNSSTALEIAMALATLTTHMDVYDPAYHCQTSCVWWPSFYGHVSAIVRFIREFQSPV